MTPLRSSRRARPDWRRSLAVAVLAAVACLAFAAPGRAVAHEPGAASDVAARAAFAAYCQRLSASGATTGPYEATLTDLRLRSSCTFQLDDPWRLAAVPEELAQIDTALNGRSQAYRSVIYDTARKYQLPPAYLGAVMMAESRGDAFAVGDRGHSMGLFQLHDQGLGQSLGERRLDPVLSAQIAAAALSEGWREGLKRGLSGDDLVGFAYGYKFNPGGDRHESGSTVRAIYRRFTGGVAMPGDPPVDFSGILQDAAVFGGGASGDYFVTLFRPEDVPYSGPHSLAEVSSGGKGGAAGSGDSAAQDQGNALSFLPMFSFGAPGAAVVLLLLLGMAAGIAYRVRPVPITAGGRQHRQPANHFAQGSVLAMAMFRRKNEKTGDEAVADITAPAATATATAEATTTYAPAGPETEASSERIRILEEQIRDQRALLDQAESEFHQETAGLKVYLQRQTATLDAILNQLEQRLRPLRDYVAKEETNLNNLVEDMTRRPEDFVAENFAGYIATQKANIESTRKSIEQQRNPFIDYFEEQIEAMELGLKRFDPFIQRLAANLDEQQEILEGFLGAMRDDHFQAVRGYLDERAEAWKQFASSGETDPTDTYRRLRQLRDAFSRIAQGQQHLSEVLTQTAKADDHLTDLVRPQGRTDAPIPMPIREELRPATEPSEPVAAAAESED